MTKHKGRRRRTRNFQTWNVNVEVSASTLADGVAVAATLLNLSQDVYLVSGDFRASIRGAAANEKPVTCGVANGDLSVTEIAEKLDAAPSSQSAIIELERQRRPVRKIGTFGDGPLVAETLNDGKSIRVKLGFAIANSTNLDFWLRNQSGATLTTGMILELQGEVYGYWK